MGLRPDGISNGVAKAGGCVSHPPYPGRRIPREVILPWPHVMCAARDAATMGLIHPSMRPVIRMSPNSRPCVLALWWHGWCH